MEQRQKASKQDIDQMLNGHGSTQDRRDEWDDLQDNKMSVRELQSAWLASRQEESAVATELNVMKREMAVMLERASMIR